MNPSGRLALETYKQNRHNAWKGASTKVRGDDPNIAANRIFDSLATVVPTACDNIRLTSDTAIFTMGSCFARAIENVLLESGFNVVSVDESLLDTAEFRHANTYRSGILNRFTPRAMWQEFKRCFDELDNWNEESSLLHPTSSGGWIDLHYWNVGEVDPSTAGVMKRRAVGRELTRRAAQADLVILTLGLTETWRDVKTGLYCNYMSPKVLKQASESFEFGVATFGDTLMCLEDMRDLIRRHHKSGGPQFLVTVSPVPLRATFTDQDVIVANSASKATLRAAAGEFCASHPDVTYFPSYEIVNYTNPQMAWMPDRLHVNLPTVRHIADTFMKTFVESSQADQAA